MAPHRAPCPPVDGRWSTDPVGPASRRSRPFRRPAPRSPRPSAPPPCRAASDPGPLRAGARPGPTLFVRLSRRAGGEGVRRRTRASTSAVVRPSPSGATGRGNRNRAERPTPHGVQRSAADRLGPSGASSVFRGRGPSPPSAAGSTPRIPRTAARPARPHRPPTPRGCPEVARPDGYPAIPCRCARGTRGAPAPSRQRARPPVASRRRPHPRSYDHLCHHAVISSRPDRTRGAGGGWFPRIPYGRRRPDGILTTRTRVRAEPRRGVRTTSRRRELTD